MAHTIHKVTRFEKVGPFTLTVWFEDQTQQTIDFQPALAGELYGPLQDQRLFDQVHLDAEVSTLVWPNGADFAPTTLDDWSTAGHQLIALAQTWSTTIS